MVGALSEIELIDTWLYFELRDYVRACFPQETEYYASLPAGIWHAYVNDATRPLRNAHMAERLALSAGQPNHNLGKLYLRAARPDVEGQEAVGWHREEMYGAPKGTVNFWMPIRGCTVENAMRYIPGSEGAFVATQANDAQGVTKGSDGNEIGLLYAPKEIIEGVDFSAAKPLVVPYGKAALFSGSLIHGASQNTGPEIRFSVDFRIYP